MKNDRGHRRCRDPGTWAHDEDGTTEEKKKQTLTIESNGVRIMGHAHIVPSQRTRRTESLRPRRRK